jgi:hypothetical protein
MVSWNGATTMDYGASSPFTFLEGRWQKFNPATQVYNKNQRNTRVWRGACAEAYMGTGIAKYKKLGDSITHGYLSTPNPSVANTPQRMREQIAKILPHVGTGWVYPIDLAGNDPRWVATGTWSILPSYGPYGVGVQQSNTVGSTYTFTPVENVTDFKIAFLKNTGTGIITLKVDAGADVTVDTANAGGLAYGEYTINAGASGTHSLKVTVPSDGKPFFLLAFKGINGTSGIEITTCAKGGSKFSDLIASANGNGSSIATAIDADPAHLTSLHLGMNEYLQQIPLVDYKANAKIAIDRVKATGSDILLIATIPDGTALKAIPQTSYRSVLYDLADEYDIPLLDLYERWGSYATGNALGFYGDPTHPDNKGYMDIGLAELAAILPY